MRTEWVTGSEFPIIVTSYEVVLADKAALQHVHRPNNPDNPPHPIPSLSLYLCMCVIHQVFCAVCCVLCVCVGGLEDHHRDEGHRLKNMNCKLIKVLKNFNSENRLLLSGTPLQNSLRYV